MGKLKPEDLEKIAQKMRREMNLREGASKAKVIVHMGTCGIAAGARAVMSAMVEEVEKRDISDVLVSISSCAGLCSREPMMTVELKDQTPVKYADLDEEKANKIFKEHVLDGNAVSEFALGKGSERLS